MSEVERELGISYPTVCKRLNLVNQLLNNTPRGNVNQLAILGHVDRGELTAKETAQLLKGGALTMPSQIEWQADHGRRSGS